ncbi:hypothetical protein HAX54_043335 [Datura stramonium]|uniref:BZIP domain-containing protein n=1 Tax=Datura stramonium TaxID=4076 RepID=A0ABS8SNA2_DATST|nr:hypothetical protein [Datura stramonium]
MAQLPPKVPTMAHNWPFQNMPPLPNSVTIAANHHSNSWVDDFLDFSAARRNSHRRSVSDPIAFVEAPFLQQCSSRGAGFDKLDDEQLTTMFSDDSGGAAFAVTAPSSNPSSTNPSTPSDQISENNEDQKSPVPLDVNQVVVQPKNEPGEVESDNQSPAATKNPANDSSDNNSIVDPKRIKRILANRQSAQRSRVRKLQYISELERSVTTLQTEVSALSPRVAFLDHQRLLLNVDNSALRQRIAALAQDKIFKDAHQEALKKEIERLRQIYHEQNMKKMNSTAAPMSCTEEA